MYKDKDKGNQNSELVQYIVKFMKTCLNTIKQPNAESCRRSIISKLYAAVYESLQMGS